MSRQYWEREASYRRRLIIAVPIAACIVACLFLTSDQVSFEDVEKVIGWKGELQIMPEITIIPDEDTDVSQNHERRLETMATIDLDLTEGEGYDAAQLINSKRKEETEILDYDEWDEYIIRTIQSSHDVPYSDEYVLLKMIEPTYPPSELKAGIEGNVTVELFVNDVGKVEKAIVLSANGPKSFQDATLEAVYQFEFQPPIEDGQPSTMWVKFKVKFRIFG